MDADNDFEKWMESNAAPKNGNRGRVWDDWPDAMKDEIARCVARNDEHPNRQVPIGSLLERWQEIYGQTVSRDSLNRYCRKVLGRRSFTIKAR